MIRAANLLIIDRQVDRLCYISCHNSKFESKNNKITFNFDALIEISTLVFDKYAVVRLSHVL